jgi:hypothetical protein
MKIDQLSDADIVNFYKTEFFNEWCSATSSKMSLTPNDIRKILKDILVY